MLRAGLVEVLAADRAKAQALVLADDLRWEREGQRVAGPGANVELVAVDVRRTELVAVARMVDLTGIDLERAVGAIEATHTRPAKVDRVPQPKCVARGHPRNVEPDGRPA